MSQTRQPIPYTSSPYLLVLSDLILWIRITFVWPPWAGIPSIVLPILPFRSGKLDELYPSLANIYNVILQLIFTTIQAIFIISLPFLTTLGLTSYTPILVFTTLSFVLITRLLSDLLLNGYQHEFSSNPSLLPNSNLHPSEKWIFINGVAAGSHWTQCALDRLSLTFGRPIHGIHNPTRGILFDLLECIVERTFSYATPSTRRIYTRLLTTINNPSYTKIILIMHSQGAIEGGLALDWLFATASASDLARVEIYTFGSAANHFNNPTTSPSSSSSSSSSDSNTLDSPSTPRLIKYIEHYANSGDYVSKFGILNFRPLPPSMLASGPGRWSLARRMYMYAWNATLGIEVENQYVGRLFIREGSGHQFVRNYIDDLFLSGREEFMDGFVDAELLRDDDVVVVVVAGGEGNGMAMEKEKGLRVKDVSRLWMYRNGGSPMD